MNQFDVIGNQVRSTLQNKASGAAATLRRETSLVQQAARLTGKMNRMGDKLLTGKEESSHSVRREGPKPSRPVYTAPDGYVRCSPVQTVRVDPEYKRRIRKKIAGGIVLGACIIVGLWLLLQTNLLSY